jgi:hypothetical protein
MRLFIVYFILSLSLFLLTTTVQKSYGQCCSAGSPLGSSTYGGIVGKNTIRMSTFIRYSQSDDYYSGTEKEPNYGLISYNDFLFQGLIMAYGLTKKLNIETELGYFYHKTQYFKTDPLTPQTILNGYGLSNGIISMKYALFKNISKGLELTIGAGMKFPFTKTPQYDENNALLPEDIQPSTCAFGWMAQMMFQKEFKPQRITMFLHSRYEKNYTSDIGYKYGDKLRVSYIASKRIQKQFGAIFQVRYEYIAQDENNGALQMNTGANLISVSPQVLYSLKNKWNFILAGELPVYKNYKGTQMSNNYAVSLSLNYDLCL